MRQKLIAATFGLASVIFLGTSSVAFAQSEKYPSRPIKLIVGYPPGGSTDIAARILAEQLARSLGQSVVVENKSGASGTIGAAFVAKSDPDGYTLLFGSATDVANNRATIKNVPYETLKDFQPITLVGRVPFLLLTNPSVPVTTVSELIAWIKSNPGKVNYSTFGRGTSNHFAGESFKLATGIEALPVPYKGSSPSLAGVMGGEVQYTFDSVTASLPAVGGGRLKAIAITAPDRSPLVPNVPTMAESGVPGFVAGTWWGILAPANTPKAIIERLHTAIIEILRSTETNKRFTDLGAQLVGNTPQEFAEFIRSEAERSVAIAARIGLKPE